MSIRVCVAIGFGFAGGTGPVADAARLPPAPPSAVAPSGNAGLPDIPVAFDPGWSGVPIDPLLTVDPVDPRSLLVDPAAPAAVAEPPGVAAIALGLLAGAALRARPRRAASARA